jgi:prepilin-type processing-associated H-X9-DG protein
MHNSQFTVLLADGHAGSAMHDPVSGHWALRIEHCALMED